MNQFRALLKPCLSFGLWTSVTFGLLAALTMLSEPAYAQQINLDFGQGGEATGRIIQIIALVTVLTGEYMGLSTADLVHLKLDIKRWSDISTNCGQVDTHYAPLAS